MSEINRQATRPDVTTIILNWNGGKDTIECLSSLQNTKYPSNRIVVIDNGSTDDSVEKIQAYFPEVKIIENSENLGYAGGNNVGLRFILAEGTAYALLLNNDTIVEPDFLNALVEAAEAKATIGMVGPTIYYFDHPQIIWSAGGAINWLTGRSHMIGLNEINQGQYGLHPREVDFITGCAILVKREVLEQVGLLDERFFLYFEETEWCVRVRGVGFEILHVPQASILHKINPEKQEISPQVLYYMARNRWLLFKLIGVGFWVWIYAFIVDYLRPLLAWSVKPKWASKRPLRRILIVAVMDALRGNWGKMP